MQDIECKVSIIIPTFNAGEIFDELLSSLKKQSIKNFELIVIDSSSTDITVEIAKSYNAKIIIIPKEEFDHGETRTRAAKIAEGDIIIFFTQDALPHNEKTIENILRVFEDKEIGAAYGKQIPYDSTDLFGKHLRYFNYPVVSCVREYNDKKEYGIRTAFLSNSFADYRKEVLKEIGWFKNNLIFGEDVQAGAKILKAGYKIAYVSEAKVYHSHSYTVWQEFKRYFDIGVFHKCENWILDEFGKPEGEGIRYVRSELRFLLDHKAYHLLPEFLVRNLLKFVGYKLGYNYDKIPRSIVRKLSMHPLWWNKDENK